MKQDVIDPMRNAPIRIRQVFTSPPFVILVGILVCASITVYLFWYSSIGSFPQFPPHSDNTYIELGEAFLHGQISLLEKPSPALIALRDPYDPMQRTMSYLWDTSYYNGEYYVYWGPVPGLAFAVVEGITHRQPSGSWLVIFCYIGISFILLGILFQIWKYFFPSAPGVSLGFCILISLINLPILFLLARPVVYETSIITGQFFLCLGLLCWVMYVTGEKKNGWLVGAGLSWGLAIASRYNLAISIVFYLAFILPQLIRDNKTNFRMRKKLAFLLAPLAVCVSGLAAYNLARFGNPLETGFTYQLGLPDVGEPHYSISYLLSNFFIYLFYPITTAKSFPFILSTLPMEARFDEVVAGLFPSIPSTWLLGLVIPVSIFARRVTGLGQRDVIPRSLRSLLAMVMVAALAQFLFLTLFYFNAMRYIADFYLQLALGIWILVWEVDHVIRSHKALRVLFWLVVIGLVFWTVAIGFFSGFDIPPQTFRTSNPVLYHQLETYWNNLYSRTVSLFY